ncbi:hypothetical protein [Inquilinus sp. OTU3971]|uniref:hypothetical protein n=1 Tax=Inquilinus sp. OTU3971 TaxID=3043855 RepID=UPI00313EFFB9
MTEVLHFPYKPRIGLMCFGAVFFLAGGVLMAHKAATTNRGLVINHLVELSVGGARIFYGVFAGVSALFVLTCLFALAAGLFSRQSVELSDSDLSVPKNLFSPDPIILPISAIREVRLQTASRQRRLSIRHAGGVLYISETLLPSRSSFEALQAAILERLRRFNYVRSQNWR